MSQKKSSGVGGALAGAAVGAAVAGPIGALVGFVIGGAATDKSGSTKREISCYSDGQPVYRDSPSDLSRK